MSVFELTFEGLRTGGAVEGTLVVIADLPAGQRYCYYPDLDIVALSALLDPCQHAQAIDDLQAEWRARLREIRPVA